MYNFPDTILFIDISNPHNVGKKITNTNKYFFKIASTLPIQPFFKTSVQHY